MAFFHGAGPAQVDSLTPRRIMFWYDRAEEWAAHMKKLKKQRARK